MASGINDTFRQVGIAVGIAAWGALFLGRGADKVAELAAGTPAAEGDHPRQLIEAASSGNLGQALNAVPRGARETVSHAAREGFLSGINEILLLGGAARPHRVRAGPAARPRGRDRARGGPRGGRRARQDRRPARLRRSARLAWVPRWPSTVRRGRPSALTADDVLGSAASVSSFCSRCSSRPQRRPPPPPKSSARAAKPSTKAAKRRRRRRGRRRTAEMAVQADSPEGR